MLAISNATDRWSVTGDAGHPEILEREREESYEDRDETQRTLTSELLLKNQHDIVGKQNPTKLPRRSRLLDEIAKWESQNSIFQAKGREGRIEEATTSHTTLDTVQEVVSRENLNLDAEIREIMRSQAEIRGRVWNDKSEQRQHLSDYIYESLGMTPPWLRDIADDLVEDQKAHTSRNGGGDTSDTDVITGSDSGSGEMKFQSRYEQEMRQERYAIILVLVAACYALLVQYFM